MRARQNGKKSWVPAALVLAVCAAQFGCVQRRFTIRSNPPGALVYVDDYECGTTPASVNFIYYGTRKIRLVKDGYETLTVMQPMYPPWYEIPPIDFVSENLVPATIHDRHEFEFTLKPQMVVPPEQLLGKAEELRRSTQAGATVAPRPPRLVRPPFDATTPAAPVGTMPPGVMPSTAPPAPFAPAMAPSYGGPPLGSQPIYPLPQ